MEQSSGHFQKENWKYLQQAKLSDRSYPLDGSGG